MAYVCVLNLVLIININLYIIERSLIIITVVITVSKPIKTQDSIKVLKF